jgi:hypothetical protein
MTPQMNVVQQQFQQFPQQPGQQAPLVVMNMNGYPMTPLIPDPKSVDYFNMIMKLLTS